MHKKILFYLLFKFLPYPFSQFYYQMGPRGSWTWDWGLPEMPMGIGSGQAALWFVQSGQRQEQVFSGHPGHNYIDETESSNQEDETR